MTRIIRLGAAMATVATLAIAGCGSSKKSSSTTAAAATTTAAAAATTAPAAATTAGAAATTAAPAGGAATTAAPAGGAGITIQGFKFNIPDGLKAGATVTIANGDSATHTFTDKGGKFDVRVSGSGQETLTLPAAGTYSIICKIHSSMSGTLTVA
jgi:plastocyanin